MAIASNGDPVAETIWPAGPGPCDTVKKAVSSPGTVESGTGPQDPLASTATVGAVSAAAAGEDGTMVKAINPAATVALDTRLRQPIGGIQSHFARVRLTKIIRFPADALIIVPAMTGDACKPGRSGP
jgi:hypothetical protein